ncbi:MAG: DNA polymerase I [Clostridia bacterium]|nr:DNA polymerase I [Clostridia bacterium]
MNTFVLIDGNSLLNRAFYAMRVFTTKDGFPTNGIFGFLKLILKIIDEEKPTHFAVAFDVHAPTFRHKMYDGYKGTRKPMPGELAQQVPVLKELLAAMQIKTVELAGYEADDVIGTLSRKFPSANILIYTGDRDSYQLVKENVTVCFTKRGVSDLDRLTEKNFREKVGLEPWQIIEEKSLMGDKSDNIPGVYGIGEKSAMELLQKYGSLDEIYRHIEELPQKLKEKLIAGEASGRLSHELACIDTKVPLSVTLDECELKLPFTEAARDAFKKLEFYSLMNESYFAAAPKHNNNAEAVQCNNITDYQKELIEASDIAVSLSENACHFYADGKEYIFSIKANILDEGVFADELSKLIELVLHDKCVLVADVKAFKTKLLRLGAKVSCQFEDVTLLRYIANSNNRPTGEKEFTEEFNLPGENCAYSLQLAYDEALAACSDDEKKIYRELELPLAEELFEMEQTGVRVDTDKFSEFSEKFNAQLQTLSQQIFALAGGPFNINSPFQLSEILFEKLGYDSRGLKKNIRGGYSTSAEVLEKLAQEHEIARLVLNYREIQKLLSTYIDGIRPLVVNGLVHTTYNQTMTTTGRLSSANPNLQNIPIRKDAGRELRRLFIAREGNVLIDADYSQIELRLLAHFSGCKSLIAAYQNGEDIHAATAARVFGVALSEVTKKMRSRAKTINFGIIYGMGRFGLAKDLGCSQSEAQEFIDKYFALHPEVKEYMEENVRLASENGFVTTALGRKRFIPEIKSSNKNVRAFGERAAMNMPLQGSAADIIKIAMLRVANRIQTDGYEAKLVLQVHDELVLDAPETEAERAQAMLKEEMEKAISLKVPLIAEVSTGRSWYDAK